MDIAKSQRQKGKNRGVYVKDNKVLVNEFQRNQIDSLLYNYLVYGYYVDNKLVFASYVKINRKVKTLNYCLYQKHRQSKEWREFRKSINDNYITKIISVVKSKEDAKVVLIELNKEHKLFSKLFLERKDKPSRSKRIPIIVTDEQGKEKRYESRYSFAKEIGVDTSNVVNSINNNWRCKGYYVRDANSRKNGRT